MFQVLIPLMKRYRFHVNYYSNWRMERHNQAIIYLSVKIISDNKRSLRIQGQYQVDMPQQMAALIMVAAPLIIAYAFLQRYIVDGIVAGAVKS